jgi:GTP-binding protein
LLHLIDATGEDPVAAWKMLRAELKAYGGDLYDKLEIVGLTKLDATPDRLCSRSYQSLERMKVLGTVLTLSAVTGTGVKPMLRQLIDVIEASRTKEQEPKEAIPWSP